MLNNWPIPLKQIVNAVYKSKFMAQPTLKKAGGKHLRRSYNLFAIALIAAGASLFADGVFKTWSDHSFSIAQSAKESPVWLPHMPSKSELIKARATETMDARFKPYTPPSAIKPEFQPAVGISESVLLRKTETRRQTHVATLPAPQKTSTRGIDTVSRAIDSGVWKIRGFPEALIQVQQYVN